jgi:uncharacterized protein with HEPN domain
VTGDVGLQVCTPDNGTEYQVAMDEAHLGAILHYAELATNLADGWTPDAEEADRVTFPAISFCLSVVGGAACHVSAAAIPTTLGDHWLKVMSLRDRMLTEYRTVTPDLVFHIVHVDIPPLIAALISARKADGQ